MYLFRQTFTFHPYVFPEQLSTCLDPSADHVNQTEAIGKWLHVGILVLRSYHARVDKRRKSVGA